MKKILTIASIIASVSVNAQFGSDYLKAADRYYKSGDYASAATYYEKYFGNKTSKNVYDPYDVARPKKATATSSASQARYQLADSYRRLTNYEKAAPVYEQVIKDSIPLAWYYYATVLRALGKYAEAEQSLNTFLDKYTTADEYVTTAKRELLNLRFIQEQLAKKDSHQYTVQKIKEGASYAPAFTANNRLLFTATEASKNHLYQAAFTGTELSEVTPAGLPEAPMHEGTPAISADGNTLYFTRWIVKDGQKSAGIYKSTKTAEGWDKPVLLNEIVNEPGSNAQQPVLANDKYLLYASNKKGGQGGYDLWIAELNPEGQPASTSNLGATINTPFNEEAPYYHAASKNLVFASNGRVGMGGYDLFYSKGEPGNWTAPQNFGYPVNSVKDDIYFAAHTNTKHLLENVLISSDRTAVCCLELFHVTRSYKQYYSGVVIDCATQQPVPDAVIAVTDATGKKIVDMVTNSQGQYVVETGDTGAFTIVGSKTAYEPGTLITAANGESDTITNESICLSAIAKKELFTESRLEIRNILFAYDDATIPVNDFEFLDQVVDYLNKHPEARIEIGAHTDGRGSIAYNQKLAGRRAQSCYTYLVRAGIDGSRLKATGYGECCPLEKETSSKGKDIPAAREKNRRIEIKLL